MNMNTKICEFCNKEIPSDSKICPYCNKSSDSKVFNFKINETASQGGNLDVTKYIKNAESKNTENYFGTNIYSFSDEAIEKKYEKKDFLYDEKQIEEQNERYRRQRNEIPTERPKKKKNKNNKPLILVLTVIILILIIVVVSLLIGGEKPQKEAVFITSSTATKQFTTTTVATTVPTTTTTQKMTYGKGNTDMYGYLKVDFSSVSSDFGTQNSESDSSGSYGGNNYYYDGMTVSTDSAGDIMQIKVDYSSASDKDLYRFFDIAYYSDSKQVEKAMKSFDKTDLTGLDNSSLSYILDLGSKQYITFYFDENQVITGYNYFVEK